MRTLISLLVANALAVSGSVYANDNDAQKIADLKEQMILEGTITNVTNFGAFVDIGVHQDGLVHISALSNTFIKDPREVVKAGDIVKVKVMEVDAQRKRIALSMRLDDKPEEKKPRGEKPNAGASKRDQRQQQQRQQQALDGMRSDPVVQAIAEQFSAELVEQSVKVKS